MGNFYLKDLAEQKEASFRRLSNYINEVIYPYHPYYRKLFKENGIKPSDIRKPSDLSRIPVTYKDDYRPDPLAFICQPKFPGREAMYDTERIGGMFLAKYLAQSIFNWPRDFADLYRVNYKEGFAYRKIGRRVALSGTPSTSTPRPARPATPPPRCTPTVTCTGRSARRSPLSGRAKRSSGT